MGEGIRNEIIIEFPLQNTKKQKKKRTRKQKRNYKWFKSESCPSSVGIVPSIKLDSKLLTIKKDQQK